MPNGFCEPVDVQRALQKRNLEAELSTDNVEPAIEKVSDWLQRQGNRYWYDSSGQASDLVPTTPATVSNVRLDIPSSPHDQRDTLFQSHDGRYPVMRSGPYARVTLPHGYVSSLTSLEVRGRDGSVTDWTTTSDKQEGRGNEYYIQRRGQDSYGRTSLFIDARAIGARYDFQNILTLSYEYGLDAQTADWQDVRRGVAQVAAAELVVDDDVLSAIPDDGQLVGVDTQRQQLLDDGSDALDPYLTAPGR